MRSLYLRFPFGVATLALGVYLSFSLTSCDKKKPVSGNDSSVTPRSEVATNTAGGPGYSKSGTKQTLSAVLTVADIKALDAGSAALEVVFNENAEFFTVTDPAVASTLKDAFSAGKPLRVEFNPWAGVVVKAMAPTEEEANAVNARTVQGTPSTAKSIDLSHIDDATLNDPEAMGVLNTTDPGLNNVIPDFATAQLMFDYITQQCCVLPGPYGIDTCITFQYCPDGCYARAHRMCWIINNRYKYGTKKVFSFANSGSDRLCVQAQKWGGCCIRWWYHVAPLVTIKTPTGPKAYVFDPAMFDQPVTLATWLHFQENPACAASYTPHVSMINIQPTSSYTPSSHSGLTFGTDPYYHSTNTTLYNYKYLVSCP